MVSFWSNKPDDEDESSRGRQGVIPQPRPEPDERTALLHDGYLDPDDPAVSPYNLFQVRFTRWVTVVFAAVNFVWWTLLLISIFVSPPGLHTRGSGFFDFAFITLTAGNLLVALLFFSEPSQAMRITSGVIALFLLVDSIIILAVSQLRHEESAPGIISVIWAFFIATWTIVADRIVASGKKEEEVRLTGREETRRTLKEWLAILIGTIFLIIFAVISVLLTATIIIRAVDAGLPMPGTRYRVDGGKYDVHFACVGNSTASQPTLLLESGESPVEGGFEPWAANAYSNGTISRYCYWDRPGYAYSDNAPSPHSAGMSATALSEVIALSGEEGPWIVAGAGYGAIVARIFASSHAHDVAGLLLVDPLHEDLLYRIGAPGVGFALWGYGILSPLGLFRIPGALFKGRTRQDRVYGDRASQSGKLIKAHLQENLVAESFTKNEILSARNILEKDIPLVVVSSAVEVSKSREWADKQEASTKISEDLLMWSVVKGVGHEVWRSMAGRDAMESGLGKLVKAAKVKRSS